MKKTVLIADDNPDVVDILKRRCEKMNLTVVTAGTAMEALSVAEVWHPDAVVLDVSMPEGNGLTVCEMLVNHEQLSTIPVIILTGSTSSEVVKRCHELCAYYIPKTTDMWGRIEPVICELLGIDPMGNPISDRVENVDNQTAEETAEVTMQEVAEETTDEAPSIGCVEILDRVFSILGMELERKDNEADEPAEAIEPEGDTAPWVLTIEDDEDVAFTLRTRLKGIGLTAVNSYEGSAGYRYAFMSSPTAIILDYELPDGNGAYVLRRLKESPVTSSIPVVVLTGRREGYIERQMRSMGAHAFFTKPINWMQIQDTLEDLIPAAFVH